MPKFVLDQAPNYREVVTPDEDGFTIERQYGDTQAVIDQNTAVRNEIKQVEARFGPNGEKMYQVASIPAELWAIMVKETNGEVMRDNDLLLRLLRHPDVSKALTTDKRF